MLEFLHFLVVDDTSNSPKSLQFTVLILLINSILRYIRVVIVFSSGFNAFFFHFLFLLALDSDPSVDPSMNLTKLSMFL